MEDYQPRQNDPADEGIPGDEGFPPDLDNQGGLEVAEEGSHHGRNATMILATFLMIGAGAIWFMRMRTGPESAAAAAPQAQTAATTINEFLGDGGKSIHNMKELLRDTERVVQQFLTYDTKQQIALEDLSTNPFRHSSAKPEAPEDEKAKAERQFQEKLAAEKQAALKAIAQLELQSILAGGRVPTCMISGKAYTEGQEASGWVIEKISPNSVIVRRNSTLSPETVYKFQLTMKR